jgi:AraC-like DNA-binding protein
MGGLLAGTIASISDVLDTLVPEDLPRLASAMHGMLNATLTPAAAGGGAAGPQVEHIQLARVKRLIRENIGAATLGPARLCAAAGMSRSQLYRLFEPLGGVARHIQRERLAFARRRLADPADRSGIARIAEAAGFFEPSTFSRAFRQEYGVSPREFRAAALSGQPAPPARGAPTPQGAGLLEMLRGL